MREDSIDVTFILDKSVSMAVGAIETISAFNEYIESQKYHGLDKTMFSLVQFGSDVEEVYTNVPIRHVAPLTDKSYCANSRSTSLLDAIGLTTIRVGQRLANMSEHERPSKVIIVTLTDGEENSSREFNRFSGGSDKVKALIKEQTEKYNWEYAFLGADLDSSEYAKQALGIQTAASYHGNGNLGAALRSVAAYTNESRKGRADKFDLQKSINS